MDEAVQVMDRIYRERPDHWPYGLDPRGFDGGLYLIREKSTNKAAGFCGWQQRNELDGDRPIKVGYYSIGILPEHRRHGYAKQALQKLIAVKSAGVDCVRALIMSTNKPSLALADRLGVEKLVKQASLVRKLNEFQTYLQYAGSSALP